MALTKWSDNKAVAMLQGNYDGYIQSSLLQLRLGAAISASATNGAAVYNITENTTYKVRLYMDTRFRIAACSSIAMNTVMTNYYRDAADKSDTTVAGAYKEAEITSEAGQVYMPVVYWASGGSKTWQEVYDTIEVREQLSGVLTLKSAPAKLEYGVGEEIDLTGLSIAVAWSDGSEDAVTDYTVSGFDSSAVGTRTVTVTYLAESVTFEVTVAGAVEITGIEITSMPDKTVYNPGEDFAADGLSVSALYSDGSKAPVTDYEISGYDSTVGTKTITVTHLEFVASFTVTVRNIVTEEIGYPTLSNVIATLDLDTGDMVVSGTGQIQYHSSGPVLKAYKDVVKKVIVEEGITYIGSYTFINMLNLLEVTLPKSLTSMGHEAFGACTSLQTLYFNPTKCESGWINSGNYYPPFSRTGITKVIFGDTVTKLPKGLFRGLYSLAEVILPESLQTIEAHVFSGTSLNKVTIGSNVTSIDANAFEDIGAFITINRPEDSIPGAPWGGYPEDTKIVWNDTEIVGNVVYKVDDDTAYVYAFCDPTGEVRQVEILDTYKEKRVTRIDNYAFYSGYYGLILESIELPGSIGEIGEAAFTGCTSLTSFPFKEGLKQIGNNAFMNSGLESAHLPQGLSEIGEMAFYHTKLTSVTIPGSVKRVRTMAFADINTLTSLTIDEGVHILEDSCFRRMGEAALTLPKSIKRIKEYAFHGSALKSVIIPSAECIEEYAFLNCDKLEKILLGNKVQQLEPLPFLGCNSLTELSLSPGVLSIMEPIFVGSNLEKITVYNKNMEIPDSGGAILPPTAEIYGWSGSTAEAWATKYERTFIPLDEAVTVVGIITTVLPDTLVYLLGEEFDGTGMEVSTLSSDGTRAPVTDYEISGYDSTLGYKIITVSYETFTDTFEVSVIDGRKVTFLDKAGNVIKVENVEVGGAATAPEPPEEDGYIFSGWDTEFENVTENITVTALYKKLCTVVFYGEADIVLKTEVVVEGEDATPPENPGTSLEQYTFAGWNKAYTAVPEDLEIRAVFSAVTYTVQWVDWDGQTIKTESVRYMDDATPPEDPVRSGYIFSGWDKSYEEIVENIVITATYEVQITAQSISIASSSTVRRGSTVILPYRVLPENASDQMVVVEGTDAATEISHQAAQRQIVCEGIKEGTDTITLTLVSDPDVTAECTVTVALDDEITSIHIVPEEITIQKGMSEDLALYLDGGEDMDDAVIWSTSKKDVVTVDREGRIRGIREGTVTITARAKTDASKYATCRVTVEDKKDYIIKAYEDDSVYKELVIHSKSGKFADLTNANFVEESMVITESICTSQTQKLGGCIANKFEIQVYDKRLFKKEPTGEIQVYHVINGTKVNLFNGIIYSAKKDEHLLIRKIVAYDKLYSKGNIQVRGWFRKLALPTTLKKFRAALFKKIGLPQVQKNLPSNSGKILPSTYMWKEPIFALRGGHWVDHGNGISTLEGAEQYIKGYKKHKKTNYVLGDDIKAGDVVRDLCEVYGKYGWMNRTGTFEYLSLESPEREFTITDYESMTSEESYYPRGVVMLEVDGEAIAGYGSEMGPKQRLITGWINKEIPNGTYILDDSNFLIQCLDTDGRMYAAYRAFMGLREACQTFTCKKKFNPYWKLGQGIYIKQKKELSDGTTYTWETESYILSRTIKGIQCVREIISAKNGPFNASDDTSRKNQKSISIKTTRNTQKINMLDSTKLSGIGLTRAEFETMDIDESDTTAYFIRDGD